MLTIFHFDNGTLLEMAGSPELALLPHRSVWLDLFNPTREEEKAVERLLGIEIPTREEMQEIELSSRLYTAEKSLVMTMPVLARAATNQPETSAITFIIADSRLITVRYADPTPVGMFIRRAHRQPSLATTGEQALLGLLDQIIDRLADILEMATTDLDTLSAQVFRANGDSPGDVDLKDALRRIGRAGDLASKGKDSLLGLQRLLLFANAQVPFEGTEKAHIKTLLRDVNSLTEHAGFLSTKIAFLLDATLGLINIEQNNIIKIFSVAAVTFLPPTLIASIYGMNFKHLPELDWPWGYPFALLLMLLSAIVPFWYFRHKKWL